MRDTMRVLDILTNILFLTLPHETITENSFILVSAIRKLKTTAVDDDIIKFSSYALERLNRKMCVTITIKELAFIAATFSGCWLFRSKTANLILRNLIDIFNKSVEIGHLGNMEKGL